MIRKAVFAVVGAGLMTPAPATVPVTPSVLEDRSEPREIQEARAAFLDLDFDKLLWEEEYAVEMLGHIDALRPLAVDEPEVVFSFDNLRVVALNTAGRSEEAEALADLLMRDHPQKPGGYASAFLIALMESKPDRMLEVLESSARDVKNEAGRSELRDMLDRAAVDGLYQHFAAAKDDASRYRLAEALIVLEWPHPGGIQIDYFRSMAVDGRLEKGDRDGARLFASSIAAPDPLLDLLVVRKYDPLFDAGIDRERRVQAAIEEYGRLTAAAVEASPDDVSIVLERVQFLRSVSRSDEAYALAEPFLIDMAAVAAAGEQAFWLVNEAAYALADLDRRDEGITLMNRLQDLGLEAHPYLISMAINHGAILDNGGHHEEAAAHAVRLAEEAAGYASPYGRMWMWSTAACGFAGQGKTAEAAAWLDKLRDGSKDNEAAHMRALICLDEMEEAERLLIRRLEREDPSGALVALQNYTLDEDGRGDEEPGVLNARDQRWEALKTRPAVQQAVAKVGRVISLPLSRSYWGGY